MKHSTTSQSAGGRAVHRVMEEGSTRRTSHYLVENEANGGAEVSNADKKVIVFCHWFNGSSHKIATGEERERFYHRSDGREGGMTADQLMDGLSDTGYTPDIAVVSYGRGSSFNPRTSDDDYTQKVCSTIDDLLEQGYKKENMTLYGMSKGAFVAANSAKEAGVPTVVLDQPVHTKRHSMREKGVPFAKFIKLGSDFPITDSEAPAAGTQVTIKMGSGDEYSGKACKIAVAEHFRKWEAQGCIMKPMVDDAHHFPDAEKAVALLAEANHVPAAPQLMANANISALANIQQLTNWTRSLPSQGHTAGISR